MKVDEDSAYREGVVLNKPVKSGKGSFVNVGLYKEVQIDKQLREGLRVTVKMGEKTEGETQNTTDFLTKNEGPLLELLNSPTDGTRAWGLECLPGLLV